MRPRDPVEAALGGAERQDDDHERADEQRASTGRCRAMRDEARDLPTGSGRGRRRASTRRRASAGGGGGTSAQVRRGAGPGVGSARGVGRRDVGRRSGCRPVKFRRGGLVAHAGAGLGRRSGTARRRPAARRAATPRRCRPMRRRRPARRRVIGMRPYRTAASAAAPGRLEDLLHPLRREPQASEDRWVVEQHDAVEVAPAHRAASTRRRTAPRARRRRSSAGSGPTSPASIASDIAFEPSGSTP